MPRLTDSRVSSIQPPSTGQEEHLDDLVRGLRLRVGAGGRKSWIVRTRIGKRQINKTLGAYPIIKLADARDIARDFLIDLARNGQLRESRTFGELATHWVENVAKVKNKSWRNQQRRIEIYVLPHWGDRNISEIRRRDVLELIDGIDGSVAPGRALAIVRTLFRYALSRDWIEASPAEGISNPSQDTPRDRFLSMSELTRVYQAAALLGYPFGGFIKMMILCGQRRTEVASMKWADLDFRQATWTIKSGDTKSARAHLVPLSNAMLDLLKETPEFGPFVWSSDGSSHVKAYSAAKTKLDKLLVAREQAIEPWRLHDLRRTMATHMVRLSVPELVVGRVLNHAPQGVTAKTYALHSYEVEKREALSKWGDEVLQLIE